MSFHTSFQLKFLSLLTLLLCAFATQAQTVRLAVAANFTDVSRELVPRFERQSGHSVKVSFGSTGKLYAQVVNGAPFDILLAADVARPQRLVKEGLAVATSRFTYARGRLVLWSADLNAFADGKAYLQQGSFRKLAVANPQTAPYGLAAQQVLQQLGLWENLQPKLVFGDSIAQTFQFAATTNAEAGVVAASQAKAWPQGGSQWLIPEELHQPIAQQAVLLKRGEGNPAALVFLEYLRGEEAKGVIRDFGYAVE